MTHHRQAISKEQQANWWAEQPRRAWLLGKIGFVLITRRQGRNWISLGISPKARRQGWGTLLYRTFRPCYAEIKADNLASIRSAEKAGYRIVSEDENLVVMKG